MDLTCGVMEDLLAPYRIFLLTFPSASAGFHHFEASDFVSLDRCHGHCHNTQTIVSFESRS
jgi:hypothetical protein